MLVDNLEIRRINSEYLQRDYITDVISFHYHEVSEFRDALSRPSLEGTILLFTKDYRTIQRLNVKLVRVSTDIGSWIITYTWF